ncbi:aminotransferase class V-fold PLP-dependent enzyme [Alicyclobacillus macrosporangiidus]|uniref:L-cysteine/cystine lyase n=1 Tax=Alicyclobacillus macrosporangiidus TaxID=392015 RepID=A0A1I7L3X8_9BACL|nr:aminotransferase class V-fold PLP-dependent enzyme [Alicyclobacillus macrosporangiidus]SFV04338.1 L-cysteine/cystine lyase [Alicyclobacillus macrosporangiidus]
MAYADHLRRYFPAVRGVTYLNTAYAGALPEAAASAMQTVYAQACAEGRLEPVHAQRLAAVRQQVREQLAHLFHTDAERIALTTGTAHGLGMVLWALPLRAGDEVVYAGLGDADAVLPLYAFAQRRGVVTRRLSGSLDADALVAQAGASITPRTRAMICAHVDPQSGRRLPVEALAELCRARGILLIVDGSYGAGADPITLEESGIPVYVVDGRRWLCGPFGVGAVVVSPDVWSMLQPAWTGEPALASPSALDAWGSFLLAPDARRFELASGDLAPWTGWLESLRFLRGQAGWDLVFTRVRGLSGQAMERLLDLPHVRVMTPRDARVGMLALEVAGREAGACAEDARAHGIEVGISPDGRWIRISFGLYNHEDDVERFVKWLEQVRA